MRLAYKILIALGVAIVVLIGVPATYAVATGKGQALKGLIQTLKYNYKDLVAALKQNVEAYKEFLASL